MTVNFQSNYLNKLLNLLQYCDKLSPNIMKFTSLIFFQNIQEQQALTESVVASNNSLRTTVPETRRKRCEKTVRCHRRRNEKKKRGKKNQQVDAHL